MNNANIVLITIYAKVIFLFFLALNFNQDVFFSCTPEYAHYKIHPN